MDSAVQASLSLPATPLSKGLDNAFANQTGNLLATFLWALVILETFQQLKESFKCSILQCCAVLIPLFSTYSTVNYARQQLAIDAVCQDISPQHRQRLTEESRGESPSPPSSSSSSSFSSCVSLQPDLCFRVSAGFGVEARRLQELHQGPEGEEGVRPRQQQRAQRQYNQPDLSVSPYVIFREGVSKRRPSSSHMFPWRLTHVFMRMWFHVLNVADVTFLKLPCVLLPTEQRWSLSPCSVWVIAAFPTFLWVCWLFFLFIVNSILIMTGLGSPGHYLLRGGGAGISALNISCLVSIWPFFFVCDFFFFFG